MGTDRDLSIGRDWDTDRDWGRRKGRRRNGQTGTGLQGDKGEAISVSLKSRGGKEGISVNEE